MKQGCKGKKKKSVFATEKQECCNQCGFDLPLRFAVKLDSGGGEIDKTDARQHHTRSTLNIIQQEHTSFCVPLFR